MRRNSFPRAFMGDLFFIPQGAMRYDNFSAVFSGNSTEQAGVVVAASTPPRSVVARGMGREITEKNIAGSMAAAPYCIGLSAAMARSNVLVGRHEHGACALDRGSRGPGS